MPLILLLIAAAVLVKFGWLLAAFAGVAAAGSAIGKWLARRDDRVIARRQQERAIAARADRQHAAALAGDHFLGMYGDYPPAI
ncbi:hypothetical protein L841_0083 [Mycobacterium sp. MAC_080597_8934]|uniref:hypothetical protein n=1 Tax=unclassified Mycobacterium avium complex (MAC) TaxID=2750822 RepID=UPI00045205D5|nr:MULTISPECIES: hypothetical protein [unclassified Mycobacterium avium complex (MAC)]ETZ58160.1 hypothetical protein L840_2862 [Mycobacterium sp. MAC_011194_8550]ETZ75125.1 hypothetical protein L841_0083 [Mycobacterium sp. MAC_080597_8934]